MAPASGVELGWSGVEWGGVKIQHPTAPRYINISTSSAHFSVRGCEVKYAPLALFLMSALVCASLVSTVEGPVAGTMPQCCVDNWPLRGLMRLKWA